MDKFENKKIKIELEIIGLRMYSPTKYIHVTDKLKEKTWDLKLTSEEKDISELFTFICEMIK